MKTSLIINTASKDPWVAQAGNPYRRVGYSARYSLLHDTILPAVLREQFDEVIIAGTFEDGPGYTYVPVQPRFRDRRDALWQRERGARHATGDFLVFCHDDHLPAAGFLATFRRNWQHEPDWDLLVPERRHGKLDTVLDNGSERGYMGAHCLLMRRWVWARCPWTTIDSVWWDVGMTRVWQAAGAKLRWSTDLLHYDMEAQEDES